MKRLLATLTAVLAAAVSLGAQDSRLSYGLEWGYTATFLKTAQHNFICAEGYRITETPRSWQYFSNGSIMANAGVDLGRSFNLSVYSGIIGVYSDRWTVPAELRLRFCPAGLLSDGAVLHAGTAALFPLIPLYETGFRANLGGGYRLSLYKGISVDFLLSFNFTLDHERLRDPDTMDYVPRARIVWNTAEYYAVNASVAINF